MKTTMRLASVRIRRRPRSCGTSAMQLVARILATHGCRCATIRPVETVMRSRGRAPQTHASYVSALTNVHLALVARVTLALQRRTPPEPLVQWAPSASIGSERDASRTPATPLMMLDRLFERERRIERHFVHDQRIARSTEATDAPPAMPAPAPPAPAPPAQRLELVMRRTVVVSAAAAPPPVTAQTPAVQPVVDRTARTAAPQPWPSSAQPIPLAPRELGRLTDEVVRAIDRRIVAYRERMGAV